MARIIEFESVKELIEYLESDDKKTTPTPKVKGKRGRPKKIPTKTRLERRYNKWTPEDIENLKALLATDMTMRDISNELGRERISIYNKIKQLGLKRKHK